jgi:hypothetical protein
MHLFGNPSLPKRNLTAGAILLALSSFELGTTGERLIWATNASRVDYFFLVLWAVLVFAAVITFRVGLNSVPPDPKDQRLNQPRLD